MTREVAKFLCSAAMIAMGMTGLHLHIEYSGWVLFFGLLGLL